MKVLFVFYVPSGGVETLNRQRSIALKQVGITCDFLYYSKRRKLLNHENSNVFITNNDQEIQNILRKENYDAIVITSDYAAMERFRKLGFKGKIILEIQGFGPQAVARQQLQLAIPYVQNYCDALLYPKTPHIGAIFREFFKTTPIFEFNNCFDHKAFTYQTLPKPSKPIVAWIGRLEDNKNWREFLSIGQQLIMKRPEIDLYMFEDPSLSTQQERNDFIQLKSRLGLDKHIHLLQNVPNNQMAAYYSRIGDSGGFLCSTSKVEGAPYSLLEAMSCRCPVLTTDSDGVRSSILHNQSGKYYQIGNIQHAVQQAEELMNDTKLRLYIIENGLLHLQSQFSHQQYSRHFSRMLKVLNA
ncbi:glycosyltransferase family 4 protein [Rossellomorea sp. SC111]|uniref:glycosyltransferase family 4 protein n=1 Tax=Rossellomorea sp. SC111 TaxID=2968985 RepID=UPI00215A2726|nr:glycosyltransferase family 4 protein [Rossellomorea sp. SC111]MCR8848729.1 glycosyltransferase family 4 protein [Rossellomorea sp. SC111]